MRRGLILLILTLLATSTACTLKSSIRDLDVPASDTNPDSQPEKKAKVSPGSIRASGATVGATATITPTNEVLTGASMRARVTMSQSHF